MNPSSGISSSGLSQELPACCTPPDSPNPAMPLTIPRLVTGSRSQAQGGARDFVISSPIPLERHGRQHAMHQGFTASAVAPISDFALRFFRDDAMVTPLPPPFPPPQGQQLPLSPGGQLSNELQQMAIEARDQPAPARANSTATQHSDDENLQLENYVPSFRREVGQGRGVQRFVREGEEELEPLILPPRQWPVQRQENSQDSASSIPSVLTQRSQEQSNQPQQDRLPIRRARVEDDCTAPSTQIASLRPFRLGNV